VQIPLDGFDLKLVVKHNQISEDLGPRLNGRKARGPELQNVTKWKLHWLSVRILITVDSTNMQNHKISAQTLGLCR